MKKIALFLMIMACFMFISCDQITGPVDQGNSEQNGDSPSGSQNGTGGNNGSNAGDQGGTGGNSGTSGDQGGTGGNGGTSGDQGGTGGNSGTSGDQGGTGGNGGTSGDQGGTGGNSGTSGDQGVTGGNGGTSGDQGGTGGNGDSSSDQGVTGGNGGSSGGTVIEPTPDIQLPPASEESSKEETKDLLDEAIDLLLDADIDGGIAKIREAYAEQQNNETALYYALAELASISVDESVATLLKENMGIKNYPSKMNSLISGDWMKEYPIAYNRTIYEVTEDEYGQYVRVSGTRTDYRSSSDDAYIDYYFYEGDWISCGDYLTDVTLDENGDYLVNYFYLPSYIDYSTATRYDVNSTDDYKMFQEGTVSLPEFNVPSWFKDTEYEEKFNSTYTAQSVMYLLMANALECNSNGLNDALDNILAIFGTKFANAKALAASLTDASVEIPSKVFNAFGLEELLDGQSSLKIGKAELNVLVASMEILKGTFQWLASYDWTLNLSYLKKSFIDYFDSEELLFDAIENTVTKNTLAVRNAQLMTASKNSFLSAISLVESSYSYLVGDTSQYPDVYVDSIKEYGDVYLEGLQALKKAIQNGGLFYVPDYNWDGISWPKTASNTIMQIDMGKFFTAGYLSDIIERDASGKVQFYIEVCINENEWTDWDERECKYTPVKSFDTLEEDADAFAQANGCDWWSLCFAIDFSKIKDLTGTYLEYIIGDLYSDKFYVDIY